MRSGWICAFLTAGCLALTGCSMPRLGYAAAPTWAIWQLDNYLALDDDQRALVRERIDELLRWHRAVQLPQYASMLREVDDRILAGAQVSDLSAWRDRALQSWPPVVQRVAPTMAQLLVSLKPAQLERLRNRMAEANRKWLKEHGGRDERAAQAARAERYLERAEFFFGDLSREQRVALLQDVGRLPPAGQDWADEREARQQRLLALITRLQAQRPAPELAERWVGDYLAGLWQSADPQRRGRMALVSAAGDEMSARMLARATDSQRAFLSARLRSYATDFQLLAQAD